MRGFFEQTGLDRRFLALVVFSTLLASLAPLFAGGPGGFIFGLMVAVVIWPVTLPGATVGFVLAWFVGGRLGLARRQRGIIAGLSAGAGTVLTVFFWPGGSFDLPLQVESLLLMMTWAMASGGLAAWLLY